MLYLCQFGYGVLLGLLVSVPLIWRLGFRQVRHSLRIIGATSILLASAYIFRSKGIIRFGNCRKWIWFNASFNSRGFQTELWYSWLPLILVLGSLITGLIISLVKTQKRQSFLLIHSLLSPLLLTNIVYHSTQKMDHDFFPLVERAPSIAFSVTKILIINPTPA